MANIQNVEDFFKNDLPNYAAYDNQRKICSAVDGLKISMRKIIYTLMEKFPANEKTKTDTVTNTCAAFTNYLHGSANLAGVCDTLAQAFVGSNNYPLICGNSSGFGTRINPTCAASRYTKVAISQIILAMLNKDDLAIVGRQYFEGSYIEPKFFIPIFPILFLNGSHGLSTGYSQDIYPRNPEEIIKYIGAALNGKKYKHKLLPWFKGFTGSVTENTVTGKIECKGIVTQNNMTSYTITELPIGLEYKKYIEILNSLCDKNVIVDYEDKCDTKTDEILFEIKTTREFTRKYSTNDEVLQVLKLVRILSENFCCIDENNQVKEYTSVEEILDDFIKLRLDYYDKRKKYIIDRSTAKLNTLLSKQVFCKAIISGSLTVANKKKDDIIAELMQMKDIIQVDNSYNYLLNMPIHSISYDTVYELKQEIIDLKADIKAVKEKSIEDMWRDDLALIAKLMKA